MKKIQIIAVIAVIIIVLAGLGIVYMVTRDNSTDGNTVVDARGRTVEIPDEINSILAMKSCSLELVSFFDAVNKVTYLDRNESFTDTSRTHTYVMSDLLKDLPTVDVSNQEAVAATGVDIIISSDISVSTLDDYQAKTGIPVFAINADVEFDSPVMYNQLLALGKLFGEEQRAQELVDGIKAMIGGIQDNVSPVEGMSGYACGMNFMGAANNPFLRASGDYLPFTYSMLTNVTASNPSGVGGQPYDTDQETVIAQNPQIIFIDGIGLSSAVDYIKANIGTLQLIDAISNGQVYNTMVYKDWGTNWVNQLINVYYVASIVHAGEFEWTFDQKANEIIQLFYPGTTVTYSELANAQAGGECRNVSYMF